MERPEETPFDNSSASQFDKIFRRRLVAIFVVTFLSAVLLAPFPLYLRARTFWWGIALAVAFGMTLVGLALYVVLRLPTQTPITVSFGADTISWTTRGGRKLVASYSEVQMILPSRWKGDWSAGVCSRFVVQLAGHGLRPPRFLWVNGDNRARLESAMQRWRSSGGAM